MPSSTSPEFWNRLEDLFHRALELAPDDRAQFVNDTCGDDAEMSFELKSLLESDTSDDLVQGMLHQAAHDFVTGTNTTVLGPGALFSHYEILRPLGSGGMGQVYLAEDTRLRRKVALKALRRRFLEQPDTISRFKQEAFAASALNHPNILTIFEVGEYNGTHFIASEFVDGPTLREKLSAGRIAVEEAIDITVQMAAGLTAAHSIGIAHRDIKPENVMVRKDGLVKILDFGIAKLGRPDTQSSSGIRISEQTRSVTIPGMILGTARYMSPEQARGLPVDSRTDIFSLGAILYEMLAGRSPFQGETDSDYMAEVLKTEPPPISEFMPDAPPELAAIVSKAIAKDREKRYQSATELAADLKTYRRNAEFRLVFQTAATSSAIQAARRFPRALVYVIAAAVLCCGLALWLLRRSGTVSHGRSGIRSLAILPFRNLRPDPATDFLGFSLADAVITKFGYVTSLTVRPSSAIYRFRNQVVDPGRAGAELNVDALLTGSYLKEGDDLHINTQLVDVKQNRVLWDNSMDTPYENLLTVQDHVARQIINGLELNLSAKEADKLALDDPTSRSAYEHYLRGVDLYAMNNFAGAVSELEKAAAIEPRYALTWAYLGRAYTTNASLQFGGREQYRKARAAYEQALTLNPNLIEARIYMANLLTDTGRVEEAVPVLRAVLETNNNVAEAHWELGYAYRFGGMLVESIRECGIARRIDPDVKITSSAFNSYLYVGQYKKFLSTLPVADSAYILFYRGFAEYYLHNYAQADADFTRAADINPDSLQGRLSRVYHLAIHHRRAPGVQLLRETDARISERGVTDPEGLYKVAEAYAELGDHPDALRLFRQSIEGGFFCYPYFERDPLLDHIRRDPAFPPILEAARLRGETFRGRFGAVRN
ncbi:MAG: protein kinase [Acidobacteriaceae bacterium]|nr:protein kinase [Acidobacteriaceae bacterium]MBV8573386.1 protein kinase [Acidobacteriaceae bacterium]